jgi:hypothetical protein
MSDRYESRRDVWNKVQWEGGILEALEYGIRVDDLPEGDAELAELWQRLEDAYDALEPIQKAIEALLEDSEDDEDEPE